MSTFWILGQGHIMRVAETAGALVLGIGAGSLNYLALWWNTRLLADSDMSAIPLRFRWCVAEGKLARLLPALSLQLTRLGLVVTALVFTARLGAPPLLAATLGIMLARGAVIRQGISP